ncbi:TPA: oxidoreductase [Candidatus Latescibacteria bacterium]|nr:oxidoreductase [Candidatus Latescibacterota bacterium]
MADNLSQAPPSPANPRPIVSIGAGGIVRDAHYPAYDFAGFKRRGIFDLDSAKARKLADDFGLDTVYADLEQATNQPDDVVYDVAVPATALPDLLPAFPEGSGLLIQKPMGEDLAAAKRILKICEDRDFTAAVNFQMRYAPFAFVAQQMIERGDIGDLHSMEFRVTVHTPWSLWTFLEGIPRLEILYHSIHYIDLIRHFMGEPSGVYAKTTRHPANPNLAATRTSLVLDYGDDLSANIVTNHGHDHGRKHQESYIRWEGSRGAIRAQMGVLLDYSTGERDILEISKDGADWTGVPLEGTWFPHAFHGTMGSVMRATAGEINRASTDVTDAIRTMAVVEAAYQSSESGSTPIPA